MGATPVCTISPTGVFRPSLQACLDYFTQGYQSLYGSDVYLGADSQDGELMGLLAAAIDDCNAECVKAYNAYSPATAQGVGLSSVVKINNIQRKVPSTSTIPVLVVGAQFTAVSNGVFADPTGNLWSLPASVTIPSAGQIAVTATCQTIGAITLASSAALTIKTPTRGWQSVAATANATPGAAVEQDAALRARQANSTMLPASTMLESIVGAVQALPGVARLRPYENDDVVPDANGIPGHTIALVVDGGDVQAICSAIQGSKGPCGTYGTTSGVVVDAIGVSHTINFFVPNEPNITWAVGINPRSNFSTNTNALIQASLAAWTNALGIGNGIQLTRAYQAAYLGTSIAAAVAQLQADVAAGSNASVIAADTAAITALNLAASTYEITSLAVARDGNGPSAADVSIAFNEAPLCVASGVTVNL